MRLPVHGFDWSIRTRKCLAQGEIKYVWQLVQCSEWELLRLKNFGRKSLNEIKVTLQSFGFNLKTSLGSKDIEKIKSFQHVPDFGYLREWLRATAVKLSRFPSDLLNKRKEQILRKRTWATGRKMTFQQLGQLFGVSRSLPGAIEKTVFKKIQRHFIKELVGVNYYLFGEFTARCACIEFTDTSFDLFNLSEQEKIIAGSLLGLAINGLIVDWDRSLLILGDYSPQNIEELNHYFSQSKGPTSYQFITKGILRGQRSNEGIVRQQKTTHYLKWLVP